MPTARGADAWPEPAAGAFVTRVTKASRADQPAIARFVAAHPGATAYHEPGFLEVLRGAGGLATATFVARRWGVAALASAGGNGGTPPASLPGAAPAIAGILPVALTQSRLFGTYATSLPYINYGGVLTGEASPQASATGAHLVRAAWAWARARGARHLALRHTDDRPLAGHRASRAKETVLLPIAGLSPERLFDAIGSKPRNLIRKAEKSGQRTEVGGSALLPAFHRAYAENMRDLGTPSLPESFFHALDRALPGALRVHLVRLACGTVTAAGLTLTWRGHVENPWAANLRRYRHLSGNMLLYWSMLEHAAQSGARVFDFGRSTPGSGPYRFKLQWRGARAVPLPWYWISDATADHEPGGGLTTDNPKYALAIRAWQRLPVGVARVLGGHLALRLP